MMWEGPTRNSTMVLVGSLDWSHRYYHDVFFS